MRVLLAGNLPHDRANGRRAALRAGLECAAADCVPLSDLPLRLAREPAAQLVVVFWDSEPEAAARAIRAAADRTRQPVYAVAAGAPEPAAASGAAGVWAPDRLHEELMATADALRRSGWVEETRGRVIAVTGVQAGTGATTVAAGLAFALAAGKNGAVCLAELGSGCPALALNLNLELRHTVADLIRAHDRVDVSMIREAAVRHPDGVDVLAYGRDALAPEPFAPTTGRDFHVLLRSAYDWSVADAGHGTGPEAEAVLGPADAVVVVTRLDPPGLHQTRRFTLALIERGVPVDAITVAANRYGQSGLVHWQKAEEVLKTKVAAWLPDDAAAVNKALRDAKPLAAVARGSKLTRELAKLAAELRTRLAAPAA